MAHLPAMESLFSDRLNSNYVPNDDEVATIKELLVEPDQKLKDISGEIEGIKAQLEKLLKEKEDLNDQLKAHKALLSPARRLPPDVVQNIFLHCLPTDRNPVMSSKEAPILLGRICSHWRDIALATPKLWAAIHIAIPADPPVPMPIGAAAPIPPPPTDHTTRIQAITAWLTRSEPFPVSISVFNSRFDSVAGNSVQLYLDTILQFASRWKHIHMSVPHQVWNNFLPRVRANDVPILEKIYFDSAMGYHGVPGSPGTGSRRDSGLLKAPNLRSVSLIQFEPHVLHLPLRWNRLRELNLSGSIPTWQPIEGLSITESLAILSLCPNLEYFSVQLSLAGFTPLANGDYGLPKIKLNKLLGLAVTETNNVDSAPFFDHITAPALRHLKFRRTSPNSYISVPDAQANTLRQIHVTLAMFIRRITGLIEEFELDALYMSEIDVMKCLSLLPGLKKLSLWSYGSSGAPASPYATPTVAPWDTPLFAFEDRHLMRFVPVRKADDAKNRFGPDGDLTWAAPGARTLQALYGSSPSPPPVPDISSISPVLVPPLPKPFPTPPLLPPPVPTALENLDNAGSSGDLAISGDNGLANEESAADDNADVVSSGTSATGSESSSNEDSPPPSSRTKDKGKTRDTEAEPELVPIDFDIYPDVLCPLLEDFQCSGALFSDATMLKFLRTRSSLASVPEVDPHKPLFSIMDSPKSTSVSASSSSPPSPGPSSSKLPDMNTHTHELTHLRRCRISFSIGREESSETKEKLEEIRKEAGMNLDVHYPPAPVSAFSRRYSPYDGLPSVPVLGAAPGVNTNGGTNTISANGGLGSGEPVFLYSAAFH